MKMTIITSVRNGAKTLPTTLRSVARQRVEGFELEHVIIDGASTDGTVGLIEAYAREVAAEGRYSVTWISEPDKRLYDGLNKGIQRATGDIVGVLHADDIFAADDVLLKIAAFWQAHPDIAVSYGDIRFVGRDADEVENVARLGADARIDLLRAKPTKRYMSGKWFKWFGKALFRFATFPTHTSTFVRRTCYERYGLHTLKYAIAGDFDMMLRLIAVHGVRSAYCPLCTTVMRPDGTSTKGLQAKVDVNKEDLDSLRTHGVWSHPLLIYAKYPFKIWGYVFKRGI